MKSNNLIMVLLLAILFPLYAYSSYVEPAGGENGEYWMVNTSQTIKWDTSFFHGNVNLYVWVRITGQMKLIDTNIQASLGEYTWAIPDTLPPGNFYRIKVQEMDTTNLYAMSETFFPLYPYQQPIRSGVKTDEKPLTNFIQVYPNPSYQNVFIQWNAGFNAKELTVYDVNGVKVFSNSITGKYNSILSTKDLSSGLYFIELKADGTKKLTTKLILNK